MDVAKVSAIATSFAESSPGWLVLAFALGLVHALDADHVMAVSVLATRGRGVAEGVRAGLRWATGHGLVVLLAGLLLLLAGRNLPATVAAEAERAVGLAMVVLGGWVLVELLRRRAHVHFHAHDDLPPHAHWHGHDQAPHADRAHTIVESAAPSPQRRTHPSAHQHDHGALLVGAIHGLAGSAPILAVFPLARASLPLALGALVFFGLGVACTMAVVSGVLGHASGRLAQRRADRGLAWLRGMAAGGSVALGAWLLVLG
ncbi:MAG: hypothetical protein R3F35_15860 [Myxococcota bacterium]